MAIRPPKGCISESDPRVAQFGHPAPAWLFPYADLMTELVCFFIILYALSAALDKNLVEGGQEVKLVMDTQGLPGEVGMTKEGLKISLREEDGVSYFKSGFAELTPRMEAFLSELAPTFKKMADKNKRIYVQGHTDDMPIHNEYFWSNWELSTARATSVLEFLLKKADIPPKCMAAMGFGEHQAICGEKTRECRNKNRRVVFMIKAGVLKEPCSGKPSKSSGEPPGEKEI